MCFKQRAPEAGSETKELYTFASDAEEEYIENRILSQIKYYSRSSKRLQKEYLVISIASTVILAIVPVVTMLSDSFPHLKYVIALASAVASVLSSILLIRQTKDNWLAYRSTEELLKTELAAYKARAIAYRSSDDTERLSLLVERCESIMQTEHSAWHARMNGKNNQEYGVSGTSSDTNS